jgi:hypothetical protein
MEVKPRRREFLAMAGAGALARAQAEPRLVVVGDVHGDLDRFIDVLTMAGLLDDGQRWAGGRSQLVQLGDLVDRGSQTKAVLELMFRLAREAKKAGGQVSCVIGNHEAMRMAADLRYVAAAEYESFRTKNSDKERDELLMGKLDRQSSLGGVQERTDLSMDFRRQWEKDHPLGQAELLRAFSPKGVFGKWILQQEVILTARDTLFVHGGISPKYLEWSASRFRDRIREELRDPAAAGPEAVFLDQEGPLWWRGLANLPEAAIAEHVDQVLARHKVKRIIVGHTPTQRGVVSRLGGKVILADVGLSAYFGGRRACVVIEGDRAFALDSGRRSELA